MKFCGVTRFGVVTENSLGSFRATRGLELQAAKELMFDSDKLEIRTRSFEDFCAPTYKLLSNMSAESYGSILISYDLPAPFKSRILAAVEDIPGLEVIELGDEDSVADISRRYVADVTNGTRVFSYRYDDDDALPVGYFETVGRLSLGEPEGTVISLNSGYSLSRLAENSYTMPIRRYPMNAFGLGVITSGREYRTIFDLGAHTRIRGRVVHGTEGIGWLATMHQLNDSRVGPPKRETLTTNEVLNLLAKDFPQICPNALRSLSFRRSASVDFPGSD
ncbi:glycosyltransferase [Brevibacterium aurantiacum]|uniref:glycosyltransferase n=1 Tax=Brevibacterium aurantiacum TaxID=273384 RepID=UPI0023B05B98|nr:glycosyltransferase [Brevibacterium aurantiacum]